MLTGEQYKDSLNDGRATYFEGRRVEDLPGHPILGPRSTRSLTTTTGGLAHLSGHIR